MVKLLLFNWKSMEIPTRFNLYSKFACKALEAVSHRLIWQQWLKRDIRVVQYQMPSACQFSPESFCFLQSWLYHTVYSHLLAMWLNCRHLWNGRVIQEEAKQAHTSCQLWSHVPRRKDPHRVHWEGEASMRHGMDRVFCKVFWREQPVFCFLEHCSSTVWWDPKLDHSQPKGRSHQD